MRTRAKQLTFQDSAFFKPKDAFGGSTLTSNPKTKRPIESKLPLHLTLRARKSVLKLPKTYRTVERIVVQTAKKYGIKVFERANVGIHIHMVIQINSWLWSKFIRELTGRIAQVLMGLGIKLKGGLWEFRPHTRIVRSWKQAFQSIKEYVYLNHLESEGFISRAETKSLKELRMIWADG